MREIKFRVYDKVNRIIIPRNRWRFKGWYGKFSNIIRTEAKDKKQAGADLDPEHNLHSRPLKEFILMQFTGLEDKNGKEIYEGDIVKNSEGIGVIEWEPEEALFCWKLNNVHHQNIGQSYCRKEDVEIIGNIHENPDLL